MSETRLTGSELAATREKIEKVNTRCRKLGLPEVTLAATPVQVWVRYSDDGTRIIRTDPQPAPWFSMAMHDVVISGGRPALAGYELLALVEWLPGGAIVRTVPGLVADDVDRAALTPERCDHCGTGIHRVRVYLVRETATGRVMQVGTTCAKDFLGMSVSPVFDQIIVSDDDAEAWGGGHEDAPTVIALAVALADIAERGFIPTSAWDRVPTADVVRDTLWPGTACGCNRIPMATVDAHIGHATEILGHFAKATPADPADDFGWNLRSIARSEWMTTREAGLLAAMPGAYDRAVGRVLAREARDAEQAASSYMGTVGERVTVTGIVRKTVELDAYSYNGPAPVLIVMATTDGNLITWKTTAAIRWDVKVGATLTLEGPVKAHEDRGYGKQTVIGGRGRVKATLAA
jgi:hypothetical protein